MWIAGIKQKDLKAVDCQLRVTDLCRKLVDLLFNEEELQLGNATEARTSGITLLDSQKLYAIRGLWKYILLYSIMIFLPLSSGLSLPVP